MKLLANSYQNVYWYQQKILPFFVFSFYIKGLKLYVINIHTHLSQLNQLCNDVWLILYKLCDAWWQRWV